MPSHNETANSGGMAMKDADYTAFDSINLPVSVIGDRGVISYSNKKFRELFAAGSAAPSLDWSHPFFPEYRKRIAMAYLNALEGNEKSCFAIMNLGEDKTIPVEIHLFPLYRETRVYSILAILKTVDNRLLSFDRSTLTAISEDNFQYDNIHFEFSPLPILRINTDLEITKHSHSTENLLGCGGERISGEKPLKLNEIFIYDSERIKRIVSDIINGEIHFKRLGEIKINTADKSIKIVNLTVYPIIQNNAVSSIEIVMEDITEIKRLKDETSSYKSLNLFLGVTKGMLHSLSNTINVIMGQTQMLMQITEKKTVTDGITLIEKASQDISRQITRVQNFIAGEVRNYPDKTKEPLIVIIEDSVEFAKMQFKVRDKIKSHDIVIEQKFFTDAYANTDPRILREIITSMIMKVGEVNNLTDKIQITLLEEGDISIEVSSQKVRFRSAAHAETINLFSGTDIRQSAEKINVKIFEQESAGQYSIHAIIPEKLIIKKPLEKISESEYKLRGLDILIVEDEKTLQKILFDLFDKMGNNVFVCGNGQEALEEYKRKKYDLLISDYDVAGITGIELAARIKEINEKTATILLSGWVIDDLELYSGVIDSFIPKPFKLEELLKHISGTISRINKN